MEITFNKKKDKECTMALSGQLTVGHASELHQSILKGLEEAKTLRLDLRAVRDLDVSTLQIMCSAHKTAKRQGKEFLVSNLSRELKDVIIRTGYTRESEDQTTSGSCLWTLEDIDDE